MVNKFSRMDHELGWIMSEPARKITRNAVRCKRCGDVVESTTVNDLVTCSCGATSVDGGLEYLRREGNSDAVEELSEFEQA